MLVAGTVCGAPRDAQWKAVDEAVGQGLPKTAIGRLEAISQEAIAERAYPEAIKAIALKVAQEGKLNGHRAEEKIKRFQAELAQAPAAMKPLMEAILAHWYWEYFEQNRWRFQQRTHVASASGPDLKTWDLARVFEEIDRHFTAALADQASAKDTPISAWNELIPKANMPDNYRPTLFDFLAYDALHFYQAGEQGVSAAEDAFEISADDPIFGTTDQFLAWQPRTSDANSAKVKAVRLYQALMTFHRRDADPSAFFDADAARLVFGHNVAVGEEKDARYKAALERLIDAASQHEIFARLCAMRGQQYAVEQEPAKARAWAQRGYDAFPKSDGGAQCLNLISQIEAKSAQVTTERVWNAPWPTLDVAYRNVTKVFFRAVPIDIKDHLAHGRWGFGNPDAERLTELLQAQPALTWDADLPPTSDYKEHTEHLAAPTSLKPGFYFLIASHDRNFSQDDNQLSVASIWVSDLALVVRTNGAFGGHDGFVLNATSGEPVVGANVKVWERDRNGYFKPGEDMKTDKDGRFHFTANNTTMVLLAEFNGQTVSTTSEIYGFSNRSGPTEAESQIVFFTDRAIYRPGQTISYKGVSISYDKTAGRYSAVAGENITVIFQDTNGQEIAREIRPTNDYGSFNGVFTAPRDRLTGRMSISTPDGFATPVVVEEYKRPKFQVQLNSPEQPAKLGASVTMTGKAEAYSGAAIGGAKVRWRVERGAVAPSWCWWWRPAASKAIAHGSAIADRDGSFQLQFQAAPDRTVPEKDEPKFVFTIHADVTDDTGETRSAVRTVVAGYTALQATLHAEDWQTAGTPVVLSIATSSLDNDPQPATGTVKVISLKQPSKIERTPLPGMQYWGFGYFERRRDPMNLDTWELGETVSEKTFTIEASGKTKLAIPLAVGVYRAVLETKDRFGKTVTALQTIQVLDPHEAHYSVKRATVFAAPKWSLEPGQTFTALWGTGYATGRAFIELECNGKILKSYWTDPARTQETIEQAVTEEMRGGFTVRATFVHENRAYLDSRVVDVPWSNKQLTLKWETFRSKLTPGQKETWTAVVTGPDAKRATAEMVAALYDASLDQYLPQRWPHEFTVFRRERNVVNASLQNVALQMRVLHSWIRSQGRLTNRNYRRFAPGILEMGQNEDTIVLSPFTVETSPGRGYMAHDTLAGSRVKVDLQDAASATTLVTHQFLRQSGEMAEVNAKGFAAQPGASDAVAEGVPDLNAVTARKNLVETAFFFPQLLADDKGTVKLVFTMPEALTEWRFLGFAHDKELRSGFLTDKVVTSKDLMVEPNAPRFLREGDTVEFTVKVSNRSEKPQSGTVRLTFADAETQKAVDRALGNRIAEQHFELLAKQSRSYSWKIAVPDGMGFLTYKAVAATSQASDGEEGFLPVLSKRVLVTESLPLPIRGKGTKRFEFKKLLRSGASNTLRNESLTVEMVSQPAWYAVMALPYLMEYPYECSEQVFNRYYANALARHIANSDPKIRRIFEQWKATPALESPLQKNQDLKSVMIEETPWLSEATHESEARKNVGLLFEENRLNDGAARALRTLSERQLGDGLWAWFPGGRSSEYISLYIATGFGRLRHLGVEVDVQPAIKSLAGLDAWIDEKVQRIQKGETPENYVPDSLDALFLYGRSFFLTDLPVDAQHRPAIDFLLGQARKFWVRVTSRQSQAHLALALQRFGDQETPRAILRSLKERSLTDEELGMYWRDNDVGWWWYQAPIETQALMIEAFAEVAEDVKSVEDCKVWLLKQKQTQSWQTTKATADAVYALLLRGGNLLSSNALVEVSLAGTAVKPDAVEAGTGYYRQKFVRSEIKPEMGHIVVKKSDEGVSWGSVHWQYLENIAKVTPFTGTPLKLKKSLFIKETTNKGQVLKPVSGPVSVGDELIVRIELRTDRDMEYVHLKDQRGSGTEPVNVLSRYHYQDGLGYYESTKDTASHFFIDYLPRGVYVFEYPIRVQLKGRYETGVAEVQCMYAPEFNSHSESISLRVE